MFFEGSEKKAEILIDGEQLSLLNDIDDEFWSALVNRSQAQILSSIENEYCKAFLLSESSLFVWSDRILILTCGETQLVKAVEFFIQKFGTKAIKQLTYQRKNEYFSNAQPSCFGDDIKLINQYLPGKAYRFGEMDSHHNYVFHLDNDFTADTDDITYELLAYQISEQASKHLTQPNLSAEEIRQFLCIDSILPGFILDDFVFSPYGYSLNAINEQQYLTIHVTPQMDSSYISFESNVDLLSLAPKLLEILAPKSFDLMSFNEQAFEQKLAALIPIQYVSKSRVCKKLDNGYLVNFANYILPQTTFAEPIMIDISGENHAL
ncbi:adenosylmethionine decarboxylase [Colwellia hornerae]|uniref:Adenosylmethionine decarboxylase n=1 Tax=Colwellia hornerae TaxID=89402 RepID=A0A5C6QJ77_9GAMM|nr:adenosylmethionine decarboxylase [Colwellia hornerae]TWX53383.1 adenosylmethionine decarboxylase [Colwellia hornerae]TWX60203.1 adenosylmethionine decarboxylase [Colwellia hornerae]TWX69004.1 adenosylmethionine decarboxylase [Colwellia hornerae]